LLSLTGGSQARFKAGDPLLRFDNPAIDPGEHTQYLLTTGFQAGGHGCLPSRGGWVERRRRCAPGTTLSSAIDQAQVVLKANLVVVAQ
jgi:hypothetical protein